MPKRSLKTFTKAEKEVVCNKQTAEDPKHKKTKKNKVSFNIPEPQQDKVSKTVGREGFQVVCFSFFFFFLPSCLIIGTTLDNFVLFLFWCKRKQTTKSVKFVVSLYFPKQTATPL